MKLSSLKGSLAILIFASIFLSLTALGVAAIATPETTPTWHYAGRLSELMPGGPPVQMLVVRIHRDHWVRYPDEPLGYAFLRRTGGNDIVALRGYDTRYRAAVRFNPSRNVFESVCFVVNYDLDGRELPPRWHNEDLQKLPVRIEGDEVFVNFGGQLR